MTWLIDKEQSVAILRGGAVTGARVVYVDDGDPAQQLVHDYVCFADQSEADFRAMIDVELGARVAQLNGLTVVNDRLIPETVELAPLDAKPLVHTSSGAALDPTTSEAVVAEAPAPDRGLWSRLTDFFRSA